MPQPTVSLVIATFNGASILARTLPSNLSGPFSQIVVVDGFSTDGTVALIEKLGRKYGNRIVLLQREKKGLANARNHGSRAATGEYVLHAGPDNIITEKTLNAMLLSLSDYALVSCCTELLTPRTYLEKAHALYKRRFSPGEQSVVGTPYIAMRDLFASFPFDESMINSDDTDLCYRLLKAGKRIYRCNVNCLEQGFDRPSDFAERWSRWGRGDSLFYQKMHSDWTLLRRAISLVHPFRAELLWPMKHMSPLQYLYCLPFLFLACCGRYWGWINHATRRR